MPSDIELISLSDLIAKVKSDLLAQTEIQGESPILYVDAIELTAQVVAKRERGEGGKAGLTLSVLGFGVDAGVDTKTTVGSQLTQTVTVKLSPLVDKAEYLAKLVPEDKAKLEEVGARAMVRGGRAEEGPIA